MAVNPASLAPLPVENNEMLSSASCGSVSSLKSDYEHLRPKTTDRGWNDPPTQLFDGNSVGTLSNKKALAAKRKNMRPSVQDQTALYNSTPNSGVNSPYNGSPGTMHYSASSSSLQ
eukprot:Ihof_evm6s101 gene=Ihof_evmTU6s101